MNKKPEDDKLVRKGVAQNAIAKATQKSWQGKPNTISRLMKSIEEAINKLPAVLPNSRQAGEIKSREEIETAIFDVIDRQKRMNIDGFGYIERHSLIINIKRLLRKEIFGKESGKEVMKL